MATCTIKNERLSVTIAAHGAELSSIYDKANDRELVWQADPAFWNRHAPVLFPNVGKYYGGHFTYNGTDYPMGQHGFARDTEFEQAASGENFVTYRLCADEESKKVYPFDFVLEITHRLNGNRLTVEWNVKNTDNKEMYFSIGAHPAFMCPIENDKFDDYYFEFNEKENASIMQLVGPGYFSKEEKPYLKDENIINLSTDLFKNDALVFKNLKSNKISLKSKNHKKYLEFDFGEFPYLGLWTKDTGAPFVCIEPWFGHADFDGFNGEFKDKAAIQSLMPNKEFHCNYNISFFE